tara:strand:- start:1059 stop:1454 length:396 start_codon:yes stop_codon:yes gene_type:complete
MNTTETNTFNALLNTNAVLFKDIDTDLKDMFLRFYGDDEVEELKSYDINDKLDYDGSLHELIDGQIDIYNHDLRVWAVDNYSYVEDAKSEGLTDGDDFHKSIQAGQFLKYQETMNDEIEDLVDAIKEALEE